VTKRNVTGAVAAIVLGAVSAGAGPSDGATEIHPEAGDIGVRDRGREGEEERRFWRKIFDDVKAERLLYYRTQRDRAVGRAIAAALSTEPFPPPAAGTGAPEVAPPEAGHPAAAAIEALPEWLSSPATTVADRTRAAVQSVDKVADKIEREVLGNSELSAGRPGLLALLLSAMFLIPAAGVAGLVLGIAHLRARSLRTGGIFLVTGTVIIGATVFAVWAVRASLADP
jgi:hypothetical protein